jgi:hypothetical protein
VSAVELIDDIDPTSQTSFAWMVSAHQFLVEDGSAEAMGVACQSSLDGRSIWNNFVTASSLSASSIDTLMVGRQ